MSIHLKKQSLIDKVAKLDVNQLTHCQLIHYLEANLLQLEVAEILEHDFVNGNHYDAISKKSKKLFEYKIVNTCNSNAITVSNLNNKEDVIVFVNKNVIDENEHWFYFPKEELKEMRSPCGKSKLVDDHLTRGKMMIPKNYNSEKRRTWRKDYIKSREFSIEELKQLTNN